MDPNLNNANSNRTYEIVGGVIVLLILIALCVWLLVRHNDDMMMSGVATSTSIMASSTMATSTMGEMGLPQSPSQVVSGDAVVAVNQRAGAKAMIQSVTLGARGWVAIKNSKGIILGAALFPAGTQKDVSVPLLRSTVAGEQYEAILYVDAGNKIFNLHTDTLVINTDGTVASSTFVAQ